MRRTRIFLSGPYTAPSPGENTRRMMEVGNRLIDLGYAPFVPLLSYFLDLMQERGYEEWMEVDLAFVPTCDAMLRLPGHSPGADREVAAATAAGLPVYFDLDVLVSLEPARR